jgi:type VI secretion system secreted protein VgrG
MSNQDFSFGCEGVTGVHGPWGQLQVVQFKGTELLSDLYRFELVLLAKTPAPEFDPQDLLQLRCSLRIKTLSNPRYRVVHGIIGEAQELFSTPDGMLYRVTMVPTLARALFRTRCRLFLDKTIRQIVDAVLQGDPNLARVDNDTVDPDAGDFTSYATAAEHYTWRTLTSTRLDQTQARPFVVQYNESDFNFVARLLEDEGISFHYENGDAKTLLVLADADAGRSRLDPFTVCGPSIVGRDIEQIQLAGKTRALQVTLDDYNWHKPALDMQTAAGSGTKGGFFQYVYPGGYRESPSQGTPLADFIEQRNLVESDYALGDGKARMLFAGCIFAIHHPKVRYDGEYLATRITTVGNQPGVLSQPIPWVSQTPFELKFEAVRRGKDTQVAESQFRPARLAMRPRIVGSQTAFVTTEPTAPGATVHVGDTVGCVRLRFHWDKDTVRQSKEPTSCWVRVSQFNAGGGMGAVWHPRIDDEVIVEFLEGDPDRPLVTGRVYNGAKIPPAPSVGSPTISTIKTFSIPGGKGYNEYLFDDKAGGEEIRQHAARDWNSVTENCRSELVKANSTSTIGINRSEATGANRTTVVGANNTEAVGANESVKVGANQTVTVGVNQTETVGGAQKLTVMGAQTYTLHSGQTFDVTGGQTFTVDGAQSFTITGPQTINVAATSSIHSDGSMSLTTSSNQTVQSAANQKLTAAGTQSLGSTSLHVDASASMIVNTSALTESATTMDLTAGATYSLASGAVNIVGGGVVNVLGGTVVVTGGGAVTVKGGTIDMSASPVNVDGGSAVNMTAGVIKLN